MLELISTLAEKLRAADLSNGDRIAICSEARIEYYLLTLACWKIGAVVVPVSSRYPDQMLALALENSNCKTLFISRTLKRDITTCHCRVLEDYISSRQNETTPLTFDKFQFDLTWQASILFTSGSSGSPKGVLHTIGNHYYNALGALQNIPFEEGDRWLVSLPMYHISGFSLIMRSLISGGTLVFMQADESITEALINRNITHLSLVPAQLSKLMQTPQTVRALCQCKSVLLGGAASNQVLVKNALDQRIPLSTTYGLTESASQVATMHPHELRNKPSASGRVLLYRDVTIADDREIVLKGPTLFQGYIFKDKVELSLDAKGYFHTGDLGILDEEGVLTVTGRKDRMFISGGENIYPEEIEKALLAIDVIERAYIVSVPDETMGQRPVAFVKTAARQQIPGVELIRSHLQTHLERFKIPIAFLPWPQSDPETLKPDSRLLQQIAVKALAEKDTSQRP